MKIVKRTLQCLLCSWALLQFAGMIGMVHYMNHGDYHKKLPWISRTAEKLNPMRFI